MSRGGTFLYQCVLVFLSKSVLGLLCKNVIFHMEKFSPRHNLIHTAISFQGGKETRRFDYRPGSVNDTYLTSMEQRNNLNLLLPDIPIPKKHVLEYENYRKNINLYSKEIIWGQTTKSWEEIMNFEKEFLCKVYCLGVYDCRHYSSAFAEWSTGYATPIWKLNQYYDSLKIGT